MGKNKIMVFIYVVIVITLIYLSIKYSQKISSVTERYNVSKEIDVSKITALIETCPSEIKNFCNKVEKDYNGAILQISSLKNHTKIIRQENGTYDVETYFDVYLVQWKSDSYSLKNIEKFNNVVMDDVFHILTFLNSDGEIIDWDYTLKLFAKEGK